MAARLTEAEARKLGILPPAEAMDALPQSQAPAPPPSASRIPSFGARDHYPLPAPVRGENLALTVFKVAIGFLVGFALGLAVH